MIVHVAMCPHPPLLLSGVTGGIVPEVEELRAACEAAVGELVAAEPDVVVAVGGASGTRIWPADAVSPRHLFVPAPVPAGEVLPLSLAVARELLPGVPIELHGISTALPVDDCFVYGRRLSGRSKRIGLLIMADGSARRGPKAPGYEDPRAVATDQTLEDALRAGDPETLLKLDPDLADDLLIGGRAAWQVLSGACETRTVQTKCYYSGAPFGVWYPVFTWSLTPVGVVSANGR